MAETDSHLVYVGYDSREQAAYDVCEFTLKRQNSSNISIQKLEHRELRQRGKFWRKWRIDEGGQYWDEEDGKPFSTEFSHTRFLVPHLAMNDHEENGWVLFCDSDFLFRKPLYKLFDQVDDKYAAMCVKFNFEPKNSKKMDGMIQSSYPRKLWSSFVLWNVGHPSNKQILDPLKTNTATGRDLHNFSWLKDEEIGGIDESWNYIPGISPNTETYLHSFNVNAIHFSEGGPWFKEYENVPFAKDWKTQYKNALHSKYLREAYPDDFEK